MVVEDCALIDCNAEALRSSFGRVALQFHHGLSEHSLLSGDAIRDLARVWPTDLTEHHLANLPLLLPHGDPPRLDATPGEIVEGIENNGCWMILWRVEQDPRYEALVSRCLSRVASVIGRLEGGIRSPDASLLLASPRAVVPAHFDRHHNLLLQAHGTKLVTIGRFDDPAMTQRVIEADFEGDHLNLSVLPPSVGTFELRPGDGLYLPPYAIHWVQGGDDVSIAISCAFSTAASERAPVINALNVRLRRLGLSPRPVGSSAFRDRVKASLLGRWWQVRRAAHLARTRARS